MNVLNEELLYMNGQIQKLVTINYLKDCPIKGLFLKCMTFAYLCHAVLSLSPLGPFHCSE